MSKVIQTSGHIRASKLGVASYVALFMAASAIPALSLAAPSEQWVQSSWADVRSGPGKDAGVIANWVTNTPVRVERREADWCYAKAASAEGAAAPVAGYVACNELGERPLTLKEANTPDKRGQLPPDREARSFWIAPSVGRFADVGYHLNYTALSAEQDVREKSTREPVRFIVPAFEAMKRKLMAGVVPVAEQELARVNMNSFKPFDAVPDWRVSNEVTGHLRSFDPLRNLPAIKASLFSRHADVLLSGEPWLDTVAAMLGQPSHIRFEGRPEWVAGHHDDGVSGIWDIRSVGVDFARPVTLHSVSHAGLVGARSIQSTSYQPYSPDDGCTEGYPELPGGMPIAGYPRLKEQPLISFFLPRTLTQTKVDVLSRKRHVTVHGDPYSGPKNPQPTTILLHTLDLDQDAVPDMAIFEWTTSGQITQAWVTSRYFFVNVAGEWWYTGYENYGECT
jgi:hypothetical protein